MRTRFNPSRICALVICTTFLSIDAALGQPANRNIDDRLGSGRHEVIGLLNKRCTLCHERQNLKRDADPNLVTNVIDETWITNDEISTWKNRDPHYQAFVGLLTPVAEKIAKRLGDDKQWIPAHKDIRCLACHSSVPVEQMKHGKTINEINDETCENPIYNIGVSCEACHGPAGGRESGWGTAHAVSPDYWRKLTATEKFERHGYWDVHSMRTQTRICVSCHVGNSEQKKIITHEMYAAGHPPLPSFELSQFVHQMPKHWRRPDEMSPNEQNLLAEQANRKYIPAELAITKATMVSALVTLEESMQLIADLIGDNPANTNQNWPEFANYSCFACHHELQKEAAWRKPARLVTTPGRPMLHEWPFILSQIAAAQVDGKLKCKLKPDIDSLMASLNAKPYGNAGQLRDAARELATTAKTYSKELDEFLIDKQVAEQFMSAVLKFALAEKPYYDFDSARQLAWGLERVDAELSSTNNTAPRKLFDDLNAELLLRLRDEDRLTSTEIEVQLNGKPFHPKRTHKYVQPDDIFKRAGSYNPEKVRAKFK